MFYTNTAFPDLLSWVIENLCLSDCCLWWTYQLDEDLYVRRMYEWSYQCSQATVTHVIPHTVLWPLSWWKSHSSGLFLCVSLGTSDPYVKFKITGKEVFRSKTIHKNLNPVWDEKVTLLVDNIREPLYVKVSCELERISLSRNEPLMWCAGGSGSL